MSNEPTNPKTDRQLSRALGDLQNRLGYQFADPDLLVTALTHKSHGKVNYERLEFLGDAVLGLVVAGSLVTRYPDWQQDHLSLARAALVRGTTLAEIGRDLKLGDALRIGLGERKSGGRERESILADIVEAVIGAMYQDGGIGPCEKLIEDLMGQRLASIDPETLKDPKTRLQELLQGRGLPLPEYEVVAIEGPDHARRYSVKCEVKDFDGESCVATASSRRGAEQAAAGLMIAALNAAGYASRGKR